MPSNELSMHEQIDSLATDIQKYNDEHGLGASVFRVIVPWSVTSVLERMEVVHQSTVHALGLLMEPLISMRERSDSPKELYLHIIDMERFLIFLRKQNQLSTNASKLLVQISKSILPKLVHEYFYEEIDVPIVVSQLEEIIAEYERMGLGSETAQLKKYLPHAIAGTFLEFGLIETEGLLTAPGEGFGPANWHEDPGDVSFEDNVFRRQWKGAIETLRIVRMKPEASDLARRLLRHLKSCAEQALQSLHETLNDSLNDGACEAICIDIIEDAYQELLIMESAGASDFD